jgi:hypothetical protein
MAEESNQYFDLFAALAAPFEPHEVKVRSMSGRQIHYITARTAMNRLDNVLGPRNWWDEYTPSENSVLCRLTIRLPDGSTLTKADAGGYAGMADSGDDDKSGYSDAFKRAGVKFGVARYLYRDGVPSFAHAQVPATEPAPDGRPAQYESDLAPDYQRPPGRREPQGQNGAAAAPQGGHGGGKQYDGPPRSGKALFAWTKDQEQRYEVGLLKYLNQWAKLQDFPGRMVDWGAEQVALAHAEAVRKLSSVQGAEEAIQN